MTDFRGANMQAQEMADRLADKNARISELEAALTPFADIDGEDDADYPDGAQALLQFGRSSYHALSLGDLRRARKAMQNS